MNMYIFFLKVLSIFFLLQRFAEVYLSAVGGGAFGNRTAWIVDAIERALRWGRLVDGKIKSIGYRKLQPMFFFPVGNHGF